MIVNQVYEFLNGVIADTGHNVVVRDTTGVVDFGKTLISDDNAQLRDNFFKKLIDRVGRTVIEERKYVGNKLGIRKEPFEFGAILQKIYVAPMQARKNNSWDLQDGQRVPVDVVYKAQVEVTIFNAIDTWEVPITITRDQIKSAFLNEQALGAFISALFAKVEDSLAVMYEQIETYAFATMIGNALHATDDEGHKFLTINLFSLVSEFGSFQINTNIDYMLQNPDFLRFVVMIINKYSLLMEKMTNVFNSAEKSRYTPRERQRLVMHNDLYSAISTVLKAETYHRDDLKIPEALAVPYWQSFANEGITVNDVHIMYPFEDKAIKISRNWDGTGVSSVENDCVLAVLYDEEAIATTIENRRTTTDVNGAGEFTNYYNKADIGYIIDPSENCIVFTWNQQKINSQPDGWLFQEV